jgi:O-antigen/teichoic acid export membrane protein
VLVGGQLERAFGVATALALRWGLDPARLGVYTGLRLFLDNTNRSSLGVSLGAVQEVPGLLAADRDDEAERVTRVAHAVNAVTCGLYALGLLAWAAWRWAHRAGEPLAAEWSLGLAAVAGLAVLKRHESFLIATLRAHREFGLTARVDVLEAGLSVALMGGGVLLAGLPGLLAGVALVVLAKIAFLHARHPLRLRFAWDPALAWRLMLVGLPILANTAALGCVLGLDRALLLALAPDGERAAGLYSAAVLGTGWCLDLAGRVALVLYPHDQVEHAERRDERAVAARVLDATSWLAALLAPLAALAWVVAPAALGLLLPRYREGVEALRPLLPGVLAVSLAWPARQMLVAVGRPYRLLAATALALALMTPGVAAAALRGGIVEVAAATSGGAWLMGRLADASPGPLGLALAACGVAAWSGPVVAWRLVRTGAWDLARRRVAHRWAG